VGASGQSHEFACWVLYPDQCVSVLFDHISHWAPGPTEIKAPLSVKVSKVKPELNGLLRTVAHAHMYIHTYIYFTFRKSKNTMDMKLVVTYHMHLLTKHPLAQARF
jgi:hypothetical protein